MAASQPAIIDVAPIARHLLGRLYGDFRGGFLELSPVTFVTELIPYGSGYSISEEPGRISTGGCFTTRRGMGITITCGGQISLLGNRDSGLLPFPNRRGYRMYHLGSMCHGSDWCCHRLSRIRCLSTRVHHPSGSSHGLLHRYPTIWSGRRRSATSL